MIYTILDKMSIKKRLSQNEYIKNLINTNLQLKNLT